MIIDSHEHVMLPSSIQIEKMDKSNVDKAILFTTTPHIEKTKTSTLKDIQKEMEILYKVLGGTFTLDERLNQMKYTIYELKNVVKSYPDRFLGFGSVPLGLNNKQTSLWIEKYVINNSFKGLGEFTPATKEQTLQLDTIFNSASDYKNFPLWIHTFNPVTLDNIKILMGLCKKYPTVPVIFGHMGGSNWMDVIYFAKEHNNVYLDLSALFTPLSVKTALTELPHRCLFASDAPFGEPKLVIDMIEYVSDSKDVIDMALGDNIASLLSID